MTANSSLDMCKILKVHVSGYLIFGASVCTSFSLHVSLLLWFTANLLKCSDVCGNHRVLTSHTVDSSRWAPSKCPLWAPVAHLCLCAGNSINSLNLSLFLEGRLEDKWPDRANISREPQSLAGEISFDWKLLVRFSLYKFILVCPFYLSFSMVFSSVQTNFPCSNWMAAVWSILGLRSQWRSE